MRPNRHWTKLYFLLAGILAAVALLEGGLRLTGWIAKRHWEKNRRQTRQGGGRVILCVGDSLTYGLGALPENSYPRQLERLLRAETGRPYTVFNAGVCGDNTRLLLDRLPARLVETRPDVVLVLVGSANLWNFSGSPQPGADAWWEDCSVVRLVRLVRLEREKRARRPGAPGSRKTTPRKSLFPLPTDWPAPVPGSGWDVPDSPAARLPRDEREAQNQGFKFKQMGRCEEAVRYLRCALQTGNPDVFLNLAQVYLLKKNSNEAVRYLKTAIERWPNEAGLAFGMGMVFFDRRQWREARKWFIRGIEMEPDNESWYCRLAETVHWEGQYDEVIAALSRLPQRGLAADYLRLFRRRAALPSDLTRWVYGDLAAIVRLCRERNAVPVLQTYPNRDANELDEAINRVARDLNVPVVAWGDLYRKGPPGVDPETLFAPDRHLNDRGYETVARLIVDRLRQERLAGLSPREG